MPKYECVAHIGTKVARGTFVASCEGEARRRMARALCISADSVKVAKTNGKRR